MRACHGAPCVAWPCRRRRQGLPFSCRACIPCPIAGSLPHPAHGCRTRGGGWHTRRPSWPVLWGTDERGSTRWDGRGATHTCPPIDASQKLFSAYATPLTPKNMAASAASASKPAAAAAAGGDRKVRVFFPMQIQTIFDLVFGRPRYRTYLPPGHTCGTLPLLMTVPRTPASSPPWLSKLNPQNQTRVPSKISPARTRLFAQRARPAHTHRMHHRCAAPRAPAAVLSLTPPPLQILLQSAEGCVHPRVPPGAHQTPAPSHPPPSPPPPQRAV